MIEDYLIMIYIGFIFQWGVLWGTLNKSWGYFWFSFTLITVALLGIGLVWSSQKKQNGK